MTVYVLPEPQFRIPANGEYGNFAAFRARRHTGTDDACGAGTHLRAVIGGRVHSTGYSTVLGNWLVWLGDDGLYWSYSHLTGSIARKGARIEPGQYIAISGATGNVTGAHLHIGCGASPTIGVATRDPMQYLRTVALTPANLAPRTILTAPVEEDEDMFKLVPNPEGGIWIIGADGRHVRLNNQREASIMYRVKDGAPILGSEFADVKRILQSVNG